MTTARHRLRWLGACWAGAIFCAPAPCPGQEEPTAARLVPTPLASGGPTLAAPRFDWQEIFGRRPTGGALRWSRTACAPTTAPGAWALRADRRQFRASGAYQMPSGLSLGLAACYRARHRRGPRLRQRRRWLRALLDPRRRRRQAAGWLRGLAPARLSALEARDEAQSAPRSQFPRDRPRRPQGGPRRPAATAPHRVAPRVARQVLIRLRPGCGRGSGRPSRPSCAHRARRRRTARGGEPRPRGRRAPECSGGRCTRRTANAS